MLDRVYHIEGFDCVACASNSEEHLNHDTRISSARIDYLSQRLYVTYAKDELSIEELLALIAEVESDPIVIQNAEEAVEQKKERIKPHTILLWARIAYCAVVFLVCGFFFKDLYWVRFGLYASAWIAISYDLIYKVFYNIVHLKNPLDEYLLISVASAGAFVLAALKHESEGTSRVLGNDVFQIEEHFEAILVCLLWQIGEVLQDFAVRKSQSAIRQAVDRRVDEALLIQGDQALRVEAKSLKRGDLVRVEEGALIPIDGHVVKGQAYCDTSSLTGESLPVALNEGSTVYAGTMLTSGEVEVLAEKDYVNSSSARILELVTSSLQHKGKAERFITKFARFYTPLIFLVAVAYIIFAGIFGPSWRSATYTGLEIMVISCPCAIVISVPLAYFAAIGLASKNGILIKGAVFLDALKDIRTLCSDKTGTLTKGRFELTEVHLSEGVSEREFYSVLKSLESLSSHPLAKAIVALPGEWQALPVDRFATLPGQGVSGEIHGEICYAGNESLLESLNVDYSENEYMGLVLYVVQGQKVLGCATLQDQLKINSKPFIQTLKKQGVRTVILSGDNEGNVSKVAHELGVDTYHAGLLPEEKLELLEAEKAAGNGGLAYLGDGVNDAPCLARADVGVAMGGLGSDLAVQEADVLLLNDDPAYFLKARSIARKCNSVIVFNVVTACVVKAAVLVLAIIFSEKMPMEVAVFADTGVSLLLTLHSLLLLTRKI